MTTEQGLWTWIENWPVDRTLVLKPQEVSALKSTLCGLREELIQAHSELHRQAVVLAHYEDEAVWRTEE
jgi:hypothetical protein